MLIRILLISVVAFATGPAFAVTFVPINGEITIETSPDRRTAEVTVVKSGVVAARFCLTFLEPLETPITIAARGELIYLPQPLEGIPPSARIAGTEPIAQTLTVVPIRGPSFAFVAKGVKPIYNASHVILVSKVTKQRVSGSSVSAHENECAGKNGDAE